METKIRFLGIAAFEIENSEGVHILLDPFIEGNPACPIKVDDIGTLDLILVTHTAVDHLGQAGTLAKKFKCPVICPPNVAAHLLNEGVPQGQVKSIIWGLTSQGPVNVRAVESRHWSTIRESDGSYLEGPPLGFMIYVDPGVRIYCSGDTTLFSDMKLIGELYKPNIGLLNVSHPAKFESEQLNRPDIITGEMTPNEAALAAQWLGLEYAIAFHFDEIDPNQSRDAVKFRDLLNNLASDGKPYVKPVLIKSGEIFKYPISDVS